MCYVKNGFCSDSLKMDTVWRVQAQWDFLRQNEYSSAFMKQDLKKEEEENSRRNQCYSGPGSALVCASPLHISILRSFCSLHTS